MITIRVLAFVLSFILFMVVIELVRREKLTFKYAVGWLAASLAGMCSVIFDDVLYGISKWLGFQVASNFIFFGLISIFIFLGLVMTIFLCQQDNRNHTMAQKIALLELELKRLRERLHK